MRRAAYACATARWKDARPADAYRNGRPTQPIGDREILYWRWFSDYFHEDGLIDEARLIDADQSVNTTSFGGAWWCALLPEPDWPPEKIAHRLGMGVVAGAASEVAGTTDGNGTVFELRVEHVPDDHNYHHCELHVFRSGTRLTKDDVKLLRGPEKQAWFAAKAKFRQKAAEAIKAKKIRVILRSHVPTGTAPKSTN